MEENKRFYKYRNVFASARNVLKLIDCVFLTIRCLTQAYTLRG